MIVRCKNCGEYKNPEDFPKNNTCSLGFTQPCKACRSVYHKQWRGLNKDSVKEKKSVYMKEYRQKNKDKIRASKCEWQTRRKRIEKQQTPAWADLKKIQSVYDSAKVLSERFGVTYHVDHIIPLRGKDICGLHVENNLQLLEAGLNVAKGNGRKTHFELPRRVYA